MAVAAVTEVGSRVDDAYEFLLGEITGFRLRSGSQLSENRLATQLGISRTPVREALQRLEKEGLVKRSDSARFTVSQLSKTEVTDACELLEVLDTHICRRAAQKLTPDQVTQLWDSIALMETAAAADDRVLWAEADVKFHRLVNAIAGNQLIAENVKETRRRIQRFWLRAVSLQQGLEVCADEHRVLVEAMVAKDYDAIEPAIKAHIAHMRTRMLDILDAAALLLGDG